MFDSMEDELNFVPITEIDRQLEIAEKLIKEWQKVYKKLHKLHSDIFMYAPEVLEWATGDAMSCVDGEIEEQLRYLKDFYKGMKAHSKIRHSIQPKDIRKGGEFSDC